MLSRRRADRSDRCPDRKDLGRQFFGQVRHAEVREEVVVEAPLGASEALPLMREAIAMYEREGTRLRQSLI